MAVAGAVDARKFCSLMQLKYMKALAAPGEAVGVLCAQSLGALRCCLYFMFHVCEQFMCVSAIVCLCVCVVP